MAEFLGLKEHQGCPPSGVASKWRAIWKGLAKRTRTQISRRWIRNLLKVKTHEVILAAGAVLFGCGSAWAGRTSGLGELGYT